MRLLLDEHLPIGLCAELHGHAVDTVSGRGWTGIKNGELLRRMSVNMMLSSQWTAASNSNSASRHCRLALCWFAHHGRSESARAVDPLLSPRGEAWPHSAGRLVREARRTDKDGRLASRAINRLGLGDKIPPRAPLLRPDHQPPRLVRRRARQLGRAALAD
jgi:hypothetical protein